MLVCVRCEQGNVRMHDGRKEREKKINERKLRMMMVVVVKIMRKISKKRKHFELKSD